MQGPASSALYLPFQGFSHLSLHLSVNLGMWKVPPCHLLAFECCCLFLQHARHSPLSPPTLPTSTSLPGSVWTSSSLGSLPQPLSMSEEPLCTLHASPLTVLDCNCLFASPAPYSLRYPSASHSAWHLEEPCKSVSDAGRNPPLALRAGALPRAAGREQRQKSACHAPRRGFLEKVSVFLEKPVMPSDLNLRGPLVQLLLGQRVKVLKISTLGAPVPSKPDILHHCSLLSLDHESEASKLSWCQWPEEEIGLG